jgi:hypothetical protein
MEKRKKIDLTIVLLIPNWLEEFSLSAEFSHGEYEIQRTHEGNTEEKTNCHVVFK